MCRQGMVLFDLLDYQAQIIIDDDSGPVMKKRKKEKEKN